MIMIIINIITTTTIIIIIITIMKHQRCKPSVLLSYYKIISDKKNNLSDILIKHQYSSSNENSRCNAVFIREGKQVKDTHRYIFSTRNSPSALR